MESVRVDKWLWAVRLFKTRSLAAEACQGGKVKVGGDAVKPAKHVKIGDRIEARTPGGLRVVVVTGLAEKRGPARVAVTLYEDHTPEEPEELVRRGRGAGRPTGKQARAIRRLRRNW